MQEYGLGDWDKELRWHKNEIESLLGESQTIGLDYNHFWAIMQRAWLVICDRGRGRDPIQFLSAQGTLSYRRPLSLFRNIQCCESRWVSTKPSVINDTVVYLYLFAFRVFLSIWTKI